MIQEGHYNVLEFPFPALGMNQNLSPESLNPSQAYYLENILPLPLGYGTVRYGTSPIPESDTLPVGSTILESFAFRTAEGKKQAVLYVSNFVQDTQATNIVPSNTWGFQFKSPNSSRFAETTFAKVTYSLLGVTRTLTAMIQGVSDLNPAYTVVSFGDKKFPLGFSIDSISYSDGQIYVYDFDENTYTQKKTGLSVATVPRSTTFKNTLLICNGVNKVLAWDGTFLTEVSEFVKETGAHSFTRISNTTFSFMPPEAFIAGKYRQNSSLHLKVNNVINTLTLSSFSQAPNMGLVTLTFVNPLPAWQATDKVELFYQDFPPPFSFIYAAHDRIWGLGEGAVSLDYRGSDQALRVYYSYGEASLTSWFNEKTKTVPSLDLSLKHGTLDNLEAICTVGRYTAFVGRRRTQFWQGTTPPIGNNASDFIWSSTLPVGIAHGNLTIPFANDTYIVTPQGLISLGTINVGQQMQASSVNAVDPLIKTFVESLKGSEINYRACRTFQYPGGGFCGIKIGNNNLLVCTYTIEAIGFSVFSGDFNQATCFMTDLDDTLYLGVGSSLFRYADGTDGTAVYSDRGGTALIPFTWTLPVVHLKGKRFANKRYEVQIDYPSSFPLRQDNQLSISVNGESTQSFSATTKDIFQPRGDALGTLPLAPTQADSSGPGYRLDHPYSQHKGRLKFISSHFWVTLKGYTRDGKITIKHLKLFGSGER